MMVDSCWCVFFLKDSIYLFATRDTERERAGAGGEAEGEEESDSLLSQEPDVGLDPRTAGS